MQRKNKSSQKVPNLDEEVRVGYPDLFVIGVDEVGRGCLAGPVVAGAVVLPRSLSRMQRSAWPEWLRMVKDSKLLTPELREVLEPEIQAFAIASGIGVASVGEIDRINIHHASHLAMRRAVEGLRTPAGTEFGRVEEFRDTRCVALIDGKFVPSHLQMPSHALVKGDLKSLSIACASVLAKVHRDREMIELDRQFPGYGFADHKGYSTPQHQCALKDLGPIHAHRRSFAPVAALLSPEFKF